VLQLKGASVAVATKAFVGCVIVTLTVPNTACYHVHKKVYGESVADKSCKSN
jgi:hypothetical protein